MVSRRTQPTTPIILRYDQTHKGGPWAIRALDTFFEQVRFSLITWVSSTLNPPPYTSHRPAWRIASHNTSVAQSLLCSCLQVSTSDSILRQCEDDKKPNIVVAMNPIGEDSLVSVSILGPAFLIGARERSKRPLLNSSIYYSRLVTASAPIPIL